MPEKESSAADQVCSLKLKQEKAAGLYRMERGSVSRPPEIDFVGHKAAEVVVPRDMRYADEESHF